MRQLQLLIRFTLLSCVLALLCACGANTVRTTTVTPVNKGDPTRPEEELLDVAVRPFDPGVERLAEKEILTVPEIREAEARYMPVVLATTLQGSGHWGAVRVIPEQTAVSDVIVQGRILKSTGLELELEITASDVSGARWYTRRYEGTASRYSYDSAAGAPALDPFQDVYNRIANDLAAYRAEIEPRHVRELRTIAELKFATAFSPQAFDGYLDTDRKGITRIVRLPAESDPMLARVRRIRERDALFIDTLQDQYDAFARQMSRPYQDWRRETHSEALAYQEMRRQATLRTVAGIAAIIGGIAAQGSDNARTRAAGSVGIIGGAVMVKSGMDKREESKMHAETLKELGASLGAEVQPRVIDLDERRVTLSGTAEEQYRQWRGVLRDIYAAESGMP